MATDPAEGWQRWHERRVATVSAPYGPLALTGTYWLEDYPDGRLPDIPGSWRADGDAVVLTAAEADGLTVDERPLGGEVRLAADPGPASGARAAYGERRLVVLVREGAWGVRDFDPESAVRRAFRGLRVASCGPRWVVPGRFMSCGPPWVVPGRFTSCDTGRTWAVFADATSGNGSYRFRFLRPAAPTARRCRRAPSTTTSSAPSRRPGTHWTSRSRRGSARWSEVRAGAPEADRGAAS
ncbi:DUF1684 domain-containing protein [Streptomyces hawaiiensis]